MSNSDWFGAFFAIWLVGVLCGTLFCDWLDMDKPSDWTVGYCRAKGLTPALITGDKKGWVCLDSVKFPQVSP